MDSLIVKLLFLIVFLQLLSLAVNVGKFLMMNQVREAQAEGTRTTVSAMSLIQKYHDLYTREGRDTQQVVANAAAVIAEEAKVLKDTVKAGGSDSQPIPVVVITDEQRLKAMERHQRYEKTNGGSHAPG